MLRRPRRLRSTDAKREVTQNVRAQRRVMHLGMKLHRPHFPLSVFDGGNRVGSFRRQPETRRQLFRRVAMRHPDREPLGQSVKKLRGAFLDLDFSVAVLALSRGTHLPAERIHHELQTVADTEHRNAEIEDTLVGQWSILVVHRRRPARQNNPHRRVAANFFQAGVERQHDRENFLFADAARNQLRILRPEVEDNDGLGFHG